MNARVASLALIFCILSATISWYRVTRLGAAIIPTSGFTVWQVEAQAIIKKSPKFVKLSIGIPPNQSGPKILEESFRSGGLAAGLIERKGSRSVYWTGTPKQKKDLKLSYSAIIARGTAGLNIPPKLKPLAEFKSVFTEQEQKKARELIRRSTRKTKSQRESIKRFLQCARDAECPSGDFLGRFRTSSKSLHQAVVAILNQAGYRSLVARGFHAEQPTDSARFMYWIRSEIDGVARDISVMNGEKFVAKSMIFWSYVTREPITENETEDYTLKYSLVPIEDFNTNDKVSEDEYKSLAWRLLSLRNLPISTQASYRLMLLIPIGALMITLYRSVLGFPTFGTFLPVLIAIAFRETGLMWGALLLSLIVALGLMVRSLLSSMRLLLVPRLAANLSIVIILILVISRLSYNFEFSQGLTVTLFPIVIVTMLIERMSISWEESGARKTLTLFFSSLLSSMICYAAMMPPIVQYWIFTFPELLLCVLGLTLLCGRYTGYRLAELYRFRSMRVT